MSTPTQPRPAPSSRLPALDALRSVAILLTLGRHLLFIPKDLVEPARSVLLMWRQVGWIGVDLFFVLSGFLVSGLLLQEFATTGDIRPGRFLVRRGLKIYPSFYVFILLSIVFSGPLARGVTTASLTGELFFLQNYVGAMWNHTWSLAIEEHFYLALLALMMLALRFAPRQLPRVVGVVAASACIALASVRLYTVYGLGWHWSRIHSFTHMRVDSLCAGVVLAVLWHFQNDAVRAAVRRSRLPFAIIACLSILPAFLYAIDKDPFIPGVAFTLLYVGFGLCLLLTLTVTTTTSAPQLASSLPARALLAIGRASYSIYLWHMAVYCVVFPQGANIDGGGAAFGLRASIYFIGSLVFGIGYAAVIEFPVLRFRDRRFPSEGRGRVGGEPAPHPHDRAR